MPALSEWNPFNELVQAGNLDGRFLGSSYCLLAAGPPRLANIGGASAVAAATATRAGDQIAMPIGLMQSFQLGQNMNLARFFEIGSYRSVFIPGHVQGSVNFSRPMYHGMSLLRALYAYYTDLIPATIVPAGFQNIGAATVDNPHDVQIPPGYENVFLNLASDLFKQPVGMMVLMRDSNKDMFSAFYLESLYLPSHNVGLDAAGVVMMEGAGGQYERLIPLAARSIGLITG